ncbi:hypothetical protein C0992_008013 [Termitomyces sp. T32_za158]|nr:hypothetical protein C0992_008013 [Termitomyces sp. T32_za158]
MLRPGLSVMDFSAQMNPSDPWIGKITLNFEKYTKFLSYRSDAAQDLLDLLQKLLDHAVLEPQFRVILCVALVRLCRKSELCPRCFSITDVHVESTAYLSNGGFGDIYMAKHNDRDVCVKAVRIDQASDRLVREKVTFCFSSSGLALNIKDQAFSREAAVWGQLSHPNILPFYGIHRLENHNGNLCLVSPWMHNGNIREFLKPASRSQRNRIPLISDVASGIKYLHENGVVHGDLKSLNILVTELERACLADFGLSSVRESSGFVGLSSRQAEGGTLGFEAPEIVDSESERTTMSDTFAFGLVCFEIFTGELPLGGGKRAAFKILAGKRPVRPNSQNQVFVQRGLTDKIWGLMERCWSQSPEDRPTAIQILKELPPTEADMPSDNWEWTRTQRPGFKTSVDQMDPTIANALEHLHPLL